MTSTNCKKCNRDLSEIHLWGIIRDGDRRKEIKTFMCPDCKERTTTEEESY